MLRVQLNVHAYVMFDTADTTCSYPKVPNDLCKSGRMATPASLGRDKCSLYA